MLICIKPKHKNHYNYDTLQDYYKAYWPKECAVRVTTVVAAFFFIGGSVVIFGAALCMTLPGTNVVTTVILHGLVPGGSAIALSVPFIITSVVLTLKKRPIREAAVRYIMCESIANKDLEYHPEEIAEEIQQLKKLMDNLEEYKQAKTSRKQEIKKKLEEKFKDRSRLLSQYFTQENKRKKIEERLEKEIKKKKKAFFTYFNDEALLDSDGVFDRFWHKQFNAALVDEIKKFYKDTQKCPENEVSKKQAKTAKEMEALLGELKMRVLNPKNIKK